MAVFAYYCSEYEMGHNNLKIKISGCTRCAITCCQLIQGKSWHLQCGFRNAILNVLGWKRWGLCSVISNPKDILCLLLRKVLMVVLEKTLQWWRETLCSQVSNRWVQHLRCPRNDHKRENQHITTEPKTSLLYRKGVGRSCQGRIELNVKAFIYSFRQGCEFRSINDQHLSLILFYYTLLSSSFCFEQWKIWSKLV
jgi:hypothetical protein